MNFLPQNMSILIADDLKTNRMLAKKTLSSEGYKIIEATNGIEAVEKARKYQPDLILIDGMMPKMTGFEAISLIKEFDELKEIPILMFTSLDNKKDKIKAFEAGANDYILKPFMIEELIRKINHHLEVKQLKKEFQTYKSYLQIIFDGYREIKFGKVDFPLFIKAKSRKKIENITLS